MKFNAKKSLGQNFLIDKNVLNQIVNIIPIKNNDILIFDSVKGEKMIPFAKDLILFFDKDEKKLIMDIFEGVI